MIRYLFLTAIVGCAISILGLILLYFSAETYIRAFEITKAHANTQYCVSNAENKDQEDKCYDGEPVCSLTDKFNETNPESTLLYDVQGLDYCY